MSQKQQINITSPVGRIVAGNLYEPNTKDAEGKPLVIKTGPNTGQPRSDYFFAIAIPKGGEPHWAHTPWGQQIWALGHGAFPQAAQRPDFAWKIIDGDSQIPNKAGRKPCDQEGYRGHWILRFGGGYAPRIYRPENGAFVQETAKDFVKPGYFVEVAFSVSSNDSAQQPGLYLNHQMVCFRAYGPEIVTGRDVNAAGFGQAPLPAGASMTPPASTMPPPSVPGAPATAPAPAAPPVPGVVPNPGFAAGPGGAGAPLPPGAPATGAGGAPLAPQAGGPTGGVPPVPGSYGSAPSAGTSLSSAAPPPPAAAPATPQRIMTPKANGVPYEQYIAAGWTDATLIQHGMMMP